MKTDTTKRTPGPWLRSSVNPMFIVGRDKDGLRMSICQITNSHREEAEGNASLILDACNNYERVKAERDELAAALAQITRATGANLATGNKLDNINSIARAALAKLEPK